MGLAFIGTLCSGHSVGVVQVTMVPLVVWLVVMFAIKEFDRPVGQPFSCRVIHLDSMNSNSYYTERLNNSHHEQALFNSSFVTCQDHNDQAIAVGATLAHEMGHNLGMDHDDSSACACAGDSCIMAAALR